MIMGLTAGVNVKKGVLAILAVFAYIFLTDILIHGFALKGMYAATASAWRPEAEMQSNMLWMCIGQFIMAKYFVWIFAKGYEGKGLMEGARFGTLMGLFVVGTYFVQYAVQPLTFELLAAWAILGTVQSIGAGVVAALVYRK
jgi:hypothetical protein